jgi:hypothetical protein
MLNNNNNHNSSSCIFADEIVSYLYNEATAREKFEFETHLKNCLMCADELAAFGFVRTSLTEWRETEVFALEMPRLENPAIKTREVVISTTSGSWLDNLRELFAWFPAWKTASVAFAVLIVFAVAFFFVNSSNDSEIASNKNQNPAKDSGNKVQENPSPLVQVPPQNPENGSSDSKDRTVIAGTVNSKDSSIKSNGSQRQKVNAPKTNETVAENIKNKEEKKSNNVKKNDVPTLSSYGEEEDKSLRLADLFAEIDTKL